MLGSMSAIRQTGTDIIDLPDEAMVCPNLAISRYGEQSQLLQLTLRHATQATANNHKLLLFSAL